MKEIREEAERARKAKLEKYGCGGRTHRADGGKVHDDKAEDEALIKKEVKPEALKHRADGGPIAGGMGPKLGRGRKSAGKKGTNVNVVVAPKGGDGSSAPPPPALGAGPGPAGPMPMPPRPMPAPGPGAGPMKRGGKVDKHEKHRHSGHRG